MILSACSAARVPLTPDMNTRTGSYGAGTFAASVAPDGSRHSTAHAYLTPDVLARPNLKVAVNAHVEKVLFEEVGGEPRAVGVQLSSTSAPAKKFRARATKEVILSAGAIATPHLLLLSGLGPKAELEAVGVPVVKDLPAVGKHLMDHMSSGPIIFEARPSRFSVCVRALMYDTDETWIQPRLPRETVVRRTRGRTVVMGRDGRHARARCARRRVRER